MVQDPDNRTTPTHDLIESIERKDKRFRFFQSVFMIATFLALIVIISAQQRTLDGVQQQLSEQKRISAENSANAKDQRETILRRLDCMAVFFSQTDRTLLSIDNIDKCTLSRDGSLEQFFTEDEDGNVDVQPTPQTPKAQAPNQ